MSNPLSAMFPDLSRGADINEPFHGAFSYSYEFGACAYIGGYQWREVANMLPDCSHDDAFNGWLTECLDARIVYIAMTKGLTS